MNRKLKRGRNRNKRIATKMFNEKREFIDAMKAVIDSPEVQLFNVILHDAISNVYKEGGIWKP